MNDTLSDRLASAASQLAAEINAGLYADLPAPVRYGLVRLSFFLLESADDATVLQSLAAENLPRAHALPHRLVSLRPPLTVLDGGLA